MTITIGRRAPSETFGSAARSRAVAVPASPQNQLVSRMLVWNVGGFLLVAWAWQQDFVVPVAIGTMLAGGIVGLWTLVSNRAAKSEFSRTTRTH